MNVEAGPSAFAACCTVRYLPSAASTCGAAVRRRGRPGPARTRSFASTARRSTPSGPIRRRAPARPPSRQRGPTGEDRKRTSDNGVLRQLPGFVLPTATAAARRKTQSWWRREGVEPSVRSGNPVGGLLRVSASGLGDDGAFPLGAVGGDVQVTFMSGATATVQRSPQRAPRTSRPCTSTRMRRTRRVSASDAPT